MHIDRIVYQTEVIEAAERIMRESQWVRGFEFRYSRRSPLCLIGKPYTERDGKRESHPMFVVTAAEILGDDQATIDELTAMIERIRSEGAAKSR